MVKKRFDLTLDEQLAKKFRKVAHEWGGYKKGALSDAFEQAVKAWIKNPSLSKLTSKKKTSNRGRSK